MTAQERFEKTLEVKIERVWHLLANLVALTEDMSHTTRMLRLLLIDNECRHISYEGSVWCLPVEDLMLHAREWDEEEYPELPDELPEIPE